MPVGFSKPHDLMSVVSLLTSHHFSVTHAIGLGGLAGETFRKKPSC
jgi:hypothetical protein